MSRFANCALLRTLVITLCVSSLHAQTQAKRLILKDGSYQLATQWEVKGERVRYLSAERGDWEELPKSLVDWPATEKFETDRKNNAPSPEAAALDKELAAERAADEARMPEVAPGLRLPDETSIYLLDTFQSEPQLVELPQNGGSVERNTKTNMLKAAINPLASAKQTIEVPGSHAAVQSHAGLPAIYVNIAPPDADAVMSEMPQQAQQPQQAEQPWDRFHIVRTQAKENKRVVGDIKISPLGKTSQQQNLIATTAEKLNNNWVKVTPKEPLTPGEYAVVELLGKEGMNLYVWDFGVNPMAPANSAAIRPDKPAGTPPDKPKTLEKR